MSLEYCGVLVGAANRRCFRVWETKTDTAINRIKTSETNKLSIENTSGRKWNKNRWDLQTANTTRKTNTAVNTKQTCTQKGICSLR